MNKNFKIILTVILVVCVGFLGYKTFTSTIGKDPEITDIQAEFVGDIAPGEGLSKSMFNVKGITTSGKIVQIKDFSSETGSAAEHGASFELDIEAQGKKDTVIVDIKRTPVFQQNIGYPNEKDAVVTYYENGDLEFTGKGVITNFTDSLPWSDFDYSHVYIDETLKIENMDGWFEDNESLVYCDNIPKSVKTIKNTFSGCTSLKKAPDYFQCSNLKIMDYAFAGCESLEEIDIIPVNVISMRYTFENCKKLQTPADLSKTSNLSDVMGMHKGNLYLREASEIPKTVINMSECYEDCINIKKAVQFPPNVQNIINAYAGDKGLISGASIPDSVINMNGCYSGCSSLSGNLEINTDTSEFSGFLVEATTNGDKLSLSGNSGNLLAIQKETTNNNIVLVDPEAAAQQNERMLREQEDI